MSEIYLYHGTDLKYAKAIKANGFIIRPSKEHWLGNGVYFFEDKSLAEWWTTNPTLKFGSKITIPVILKCKIDVDKNDILSLKSLNDYKFFTEEYKTFLAKHKKDGTKKIPPISQLRCTFCDYLYESFEYKLLIGTFCKPNQPYLPKKYGKFFTKFDLPYIETQYCVFDKSVIKSVELLKI
mgnify:CR=1 FL=1